MEHISSQEADENPYLCFQRTPSFRRKWRKRYGGLDGNKLLEPNKEEDMRENGVMTDGLSERNAAPVKSAEAQETSLAENISPVPRKAVPSQRLVNYVTPGSTALPSFINNGGTKVLQAEPERTLTAQPWPSISRTEVQHSQSKRKVAADVLFDSFASGGRVSTNHFFETLWCSGILRSDPRIKDCYALMKKLQDADGAVDANTFQRCVTGFVSFILKAVQGRFVIPDFCMFAEETQKLLSLGDWNEPCVLGEIAWPLIYALAVDQLGVDRVHRHVGVEEYAKYESPFTLSKQGVPHTPLTETGAIVCTALLQLSRLKEGHYSSTCTFILSPRKEEITCESGAALAATLANGGLCPMSGDQVLSTLAVRSTLSIMQMAGMNNYSRIFHFKISVPAKSSSSGIVLIVVPGVLGITCWSPELDAYGNSWRAVHFCEELVSVFQLHSFDIRTPFRQMLSYRQWKVESEGYQIMNILLAAYRGDLHSLRRYFLSGADVNAVDYDGRSALHVAASEGRLEVIKFLMESTGANCTLKDRGYFVSRSFFVSLVYLTHYTKTAITNKLIVDLVMKTTEYLQPNPGYRAKLSMLNKVSRIRGNVKPVGYPQTEGILGDCMLIYGAELGVESAFGSALVDMGQALKQMAEVRDCMDMRVKHSFIDPLQMLHEKELKEIAGASFMPNPSPLHPGLGLAFSVDQVQQLLGLIEASMDYHQQSHNILENLRSRLQNKITEPSYRPKREFKSKSQASTMCCTDTFGFSTSSSYGNCNYPLDQPCCRALFNFKPENQRELGFNKGDIIILTNQVDENWYEGLLNGESGFFPVNYVEVLVPLPQ
ncbi:hypothetical protein QTP70_008190 [Hemibagrus guttatus]|uniref:glutaminase n=1 Tax=Hemibagrus guttatus TaxID=175788 RepID=A0AAE0QY58_9TELE|nr:hypothetical protein QTP70_008190 [Hemibagrus guttatus]